MASPLPLEAHTSNHDDSALVIVHDASCCLREATWLDRVSPVVAGGCMLSGMAAITALIACLPLKLLWVLGGAFVVMLVVAALPSRRIAARAIAPSEIVDLELRDVYRALLSAHAELASAVVHLGASPITRMLLDQSRDVLIACGQSAHTTNPGARYLAVHREDAVASQATHALECIFSVEDSAAREHWATTEVMRLRQRATVQELIRQRERVRAELEAAVARIEVTTAEVVKQHALDAAAVACARGSCAERSAALQDTLDGMMSSQGLLPPA